MISGRYAPGAAALLAVALVPTVANVYLAPEEPAPGGLAAALPSRLGPAAAVEDGRRAPAWVETHFGARDFAARRYRTREGAVDLFAARTYDAKRVFHFPENALTYGWSCTERADGRAGDLPVRRLSFGSGDRVRRAAYALLYGTRAIEDPYRFWFARLPELCLGRREPTTLVYVQAEGDAQDGDALERRVLALLESACRTLREDAR